MVGIISVVIGDHFGGGDHFDGGIISVAVQGLTLAKYQLRYLFTVEI